MTMPEPMRAQMLRQGQYMPKRAGVILTLVGLSELRLRYLVSDGLVEQ